MSHRVVRYLLAPFAEDSPFDETCRLAPDGRYLGKDTLDYPLISSLAKLMSETQTTVIFGVTE